MVGPIATTLSHQSSPPRAHILAQAGALPGQQRIRQGLLRNRDHARRTAGLEIILRKVSISGLSRCILTPRIGQVAYSI